MTIETTQCGPQVIVKVIGRMDAESASAFEQACQSWVDKGESDFIADMSELVYVSSMGLRSFITVGKLAQQKGGTLRLCRMTGLVKQVFQITHLDSLFPTHDSLESALATVMPAASESLPLSPKSEARTQPGSVNKSALQND